MNFINILRNSLLYMQKKLVHGINIDCIKICSFILILKFSLALFQFLLIILYFFVIIVSLHEVHKIN